MNEEAVYRTAPATPGLLKIAHTLSFFSPNQNSMLTHCGFPQFLFGLTGEVHYCLTVSPVQLV